MTIAIIAFLESTQVFFVEQRLVWAMIIIAISLMISAGQTMFGFFTRAVGTAVAMVNSFIIVSAMHAMIIPRADNVTVVHCRSEGPRGHRYALVLHFHRILLFSQISEISPHVHDMYRHTSPHYWI